MGDFAGFGILVVVAGSAAVGAGRKVIERWRARRALRQRPALGAGSPEGEVLRVTGVVRTLDETLVAPLSARTCVVARSRVRTGDGLTGRAHRPKEAIAIVPFVIDRGAQGRVLVDGKHVLLDRSPLQLERAEIERSRREQFALAQGLTQRELRRAVFEETIVEPGVRVSVVGLLMKDLPTTPASEELGFRDAGPPNLRLTGNVEHPLVIGEPVD